MSLERMDLLFPFFVFSYGFLLTVVLHAPFFVELAESRISDALMDQLKSHRALGLICLVVGGIWSLQNLFID